MTEAEYDSLASKYSLRWRDDGTYFNGFLAFKKAISGHEIRLSAAVGEILATEQGAEMQPPTILDLGCGDGTITTTALTKAAIRPSHYVGLDCNRAALSEHVFARDRGGGHVALIQADANLLLPRTRFNFVLALNSAYGFTTKTLRSLPNLLSPCGILLMSLNSSGGIFSKIMRNGGQPLLSAQDLEVQLGGEGLSFSSHRVAGEVPSTRIVQSCYLIERRRNNTQSSNVLRRTERQVERIFVIRRTGDSPYF